MDAADAGGGMEAAAGGTEESTQYKVPPCIDKPSNQQSPEQGGPWSDGTNNCNWYAKGYDIRGKQNRRCAEYGHLNFGIRGNANEYCCACDGGIQGEIPESGPPQDKYTVAVFGFGEQGVPLVMDLALCGLIVRVYVVENLKIEENVKVINKTIYKLLTESREILITNGETPESADKIVGEAMQRITFVNTYKEAVEGCQLVTECIPDNIDLKVKVFSEIVKHCPRDCLLTTNTLTCSITEINERLSKVFENNGYEYNVIGLRFLYPSLFIPIVEAVYKKGDNNEEIIKVKELMELIGKTVFDAPNMNDLLSERNPHVLYDYGEDRLRLPTMDVIKNHQASGVRITTGRRRRDDGEEEDDNLCSVCLTNPIDVILFECGHNIICSGCYETLSSYNAPTCPFCRFPIQKSVKLSGPGVPETEGGAGTEQGLDED